MCEESAVLDDVTLSDQEDVEEESDFSSAPSGELFSDAGEETETEDEETETKKQELHKM